VKPRTVAQPSCGRAGLCPAELELIEGRSLARFGGTIYFVCRFPTLLNPMDAIKKSKWIGSKFHFFGNSGRGPSFFAWLSDGGWNRLPPESLPGDNELLLAAAAQRYREIDQRPWSCPREADPVFALLVPIRKAVWNESPREMMGWGAEAAAKPCMTQLFFLRGGIFSNNHACSPTGGRNPEGNPKCFAMS